MKLSFYGGVEGVTGSCFLVETSRGRLLIDCGMFQGERMCGRKNFYAFGFDPKTINAVVVTHAHVDHTGRLPLLVKQGFSGQIIFTPPGKTLALLVLEDTQHVMTENAERCGDQELYSKEDIQKTRELSSGMNYHTQFEPIPGVTAMFHNAGHILGSAYVSLDIPGSETKDGKDIRLVFSGDIGNDDVPILPDTEPIEKADVVIVESTYGNRDHEETSVRGEKLAGVIKRVIKRGGTLLIPAFSIERTQELLYELDLLIQNKMVQNVPIYLDSPLAIHATDVYRQYKHYLEFDRPILSSDDLDFFSFPNLHITLSVDDSKQINQDNRPKVIIAGSGMMTGGRILHHLKKYLPNAKNGVLVIGYQAEHTLGRKILDGASEVSIYRATYKIRASVDAIGSFSAHGDREKLARWLKPVNGEAKKVFLVHGDEEVKPEFKKYLEKKISSDITIPKIFENFEF